MKTILIIALIFSVNTAYAQPNQSVETDISDSNNQEINLIEKMFGKSNKTLENEKMEKSIHERDINELTSKIVMLERSLGIYQRSLEEHQLRSSKSNLALEGKIKKFRRESKSLQKRIDNNNTIVLSELITRLKKISTNYENIRKVIEEQFDSSNSKAHELEDTVNSIIIGLSESQKYSENLNDKITKSGQITSSSFDDIDKTLGKSNRYWIASIVFLIIVILALFIFTRKLIKKTKSFSIDSINETRRAIEEESIQLDNKLLKLIDTQIDVNSVNASKDGSEQDHSLALKVADEIVRIQKNISRMDNSVKGIKQLSASVSRIQDNFSSNGYEIIEMLGKPYNEGMKASANIIPDDELDEGVQIITRVIKPQVNFNDVMIQTAQIEVSIGE